MGSQRSGATITASQMGRARGAFGAKSKGAAKAGAPTKKQPAKAPDGK